MCLLAAFASHAILARTSPQLAPTLLDNALLNEVNRYNAPVKVRDESAKLGLGVAFKILDAL